jgi:hypothetical protein
VVGYAMPKFLECFTAEKLYKSDLWKWNWTEVSDRSSYYIKNGKNESEFYFSISKIFQDDQY